MCSGTVQLFYLFSELLGLFGGAWNVAASLPLAVWPVAAMLVVAVGNILASSKKSLHALSTDAAEKQSAVSKGRIVPRQRVKQALYSILARVVSCEPHPSMYREIPDRNCTEAKGGNLAGADSHAECAEHGHRHCQAQQQQQQQQQLLLHAAGGAKRRQRGRSRRNAVPVGDRVGRLAGRRSWAPDSSRNGQVLPCLSETTETAAATAVTARDAGGFGHAALNDPVVEMGSRRQYHPSPIGHRPSTSSEADGFYDTNNVDGSNGSDGSNGAWPAPVLDLCVLADDSKTDPCCISQPWSDRHVCVSESGFSLFASNILA
ncbi:hypothetical protein FB645_002562 [Coemansia sp. IMI 203386]|nr:hypothetical protein FB645_002562 [Coemansia sp. IMI 203386]